MFPICYSRNILKINDVKCYGDCHAKKLFGKMVLDEKEHWQDRQS